MQQAGGDWPLSLDQEYFDYLQIIRAWIKLSPMSFTFRHVKGHQTDLVAYNQLDWWGQRNKDVDGMEKNFLFTCTQGHQDARRQHVQPILHQQKWALARNGTKFTSICRDSLYTNLYGSRTLAYWAEKDHTPKDPKRILWEESLSAYKRVSRSQRRIDTKLLCNCCGFENRKFNRREQDSHPCPACSAPHEDRNYMIACQAPKAVINKEKGLKSLKKLMEDLNTAPALQPMITGIIRHVQKATSPTVHSFGLENFGGNLTTISIFRDQSEIG